jgi:DNA polymerase-1
MRLAGMPIDREEHARLSDELRTEVERLRPQLEEVLGSDKLGNRKLWAEWLTKALGGVGSPGYAKWPKTKTGSLKTGNDDLLIGLELLPAEAARIVRELLIPYFEASKLDGTYGNGYREHIHPVTGRVHGDFKLSRTITGRMSCSDPNVQNVPRDPRFRALYRASEGRRLVIGDYSMAEMRVAAMYADEKKMLAMFEAGEDVHKLTAASLLNKPVEKVSKEERQLAKAVGFGLLFGQSARGLQRYAANTYGVEMTEDEADSYRAAWLRTYPDLRRWQRKQEDTTKAEMAVRTRCGRARRWTSRVYEEKGGYRKTEALNTPIQGSAAEALLYSLVRLSEALRDIDALIINATHDEIVIEAGDADVLRAKAVLEESMIAGMLDVFPGASTIGLVEARVGRSWADK